MCIAPCAALGSVQAPDAAQDVRGQSRIAGCMDDLHKLFMKGLGHEWRINPGRLGVGSDGLPMLMPTRAGQTKSEVEARDGRHEPPLLGAVCARLGSMQQDLTEGTRSDSEVEPSQLRKPKKGQDGWLGPVAATCRPLEH